MITEEDILNYIRDKGKPITASELSVEFDVTKSEVNSILYRMENIWVVKSDSTPHRWSIRPIEDIVVECLSAEPITANEIAKQTNLPKSIVNSVLYRLEGNITFHDDQARPNWYLKESVD